MGKSTQSTNARRTAGSLKPHGSTVTYYVNCDCAAYKWERSRMRGMFMRCKYCGRKLGDMQVELLKSNTRNEAR